MLSWISIIRLGLVQMSLGAIVVLMTSTLNRLMIVEYTLPAILPGFLVALHYGVQISRPNWGYRSDTGGSRTRWIIGGMLVLALGAIMAAYALSLFTSSFLVGLILSIIAYALIGVGVGASGTSLLALLATATHPRRRPAAATITWLMMIFGIAVTAGVTGAMMDPFSVGRLMIIVLIVAGSAVALTCLAVMGIERHIAPAPPTESQASFIDGLKEVWSETAARNFTIFVFLSMTAYFMQELILEPYAGLVFNFTPGQSTQLSGAQNGGVFMGMLTVGILATGVQVGNLRSWVVLGCAGSAIALLTIAMMGQTGVPLLVPATVGLGFFNGVFAVAAIGSMMQLAGEGKERREGTRMGLWGAAQAIAAGFGGLMGAAGVDLARSYLPDATAFGTVFIFEAFLFLVAMGMAFGVMPRADAPRFQGTEIPGE